MVTRRQLLALTDELLEEIFLRIACPADLTRASAACVAFRRLIADPTFIRRYRSRHPPLLLGFFSYETSEGFQPAEAPHPNAPAARALANISFDYLPQDKLNHYIRDVRDGRLLIQCNNVEDPFLPDFAVCDPLSRRYMMLPPLLPYRGKQNPEFIDALFAPHAEEDDETSFRVIGVIQFETYLMVLSFFDSNSGSWTVTKSASWDALRSRNGHELYIILPLPNYVCGSIYWHVVWMNKLLKLDINRMEFSTVDLPLGHDGRPVFVVDAGEGRLGMFSCTADRKCLNYYCYSSIQNEDQRANEWQVKNVIPFPVQGDLRIFGASQGYIFLQGNSKVQGSVRSAAYSLDIKTLKIERVNQLSCPYFSGRPYFGFPPSMSPRRI